MACAITWTNIDLSPMRPVATKLKSISQKLFYISITTKWLTITSLQWRHDKHDGVSNHQPRDCLPNHLFRRRSKTTSKLRVTGLCAGIVTGEFPAQRASNAENVSIWWRHHDLKTRLHLSHCIDGFEQHSGITSASVKEMSQFCFKPFKPSMCLFG